MDQETKGFSTLTLPIRFFSWDDGVDEGEGGFAEVDEATFLASDGRIEYERHTIFENGVSQICLTKNPFADC